MLHIIILNKGYFPEKLKTKDDGNDKVVVIASPNGSIPISAFQNDMFKNIDVKLVPEIKDKTSKDGEEKLRIAQAFLIGELVADNSDFELYTDDEIISDTVLQLIPSKRSVAKKASSKKTSTTKTTSRKSANKTVETASEVKETAETKDVPATDKKTVVEKKANKATKTAEKKEKKESAVTKEKTQKKNAPSDKATKKEKAVKLPTSAQIKGVLGAANSGYSKIVLETMKKSNQVTFEMNMRIRLAETGLDAASCQNLAKSLNDEFVNVLPLS